MRFAFSEQFRLFATTHAASTLVAQNLPPRVRLPLYNHFADRLSRRDERWRASDRFSAREKDLSHKSIKKRDSACIVSVLIEETPCKNRVYNTAQMVLSISQTTRFSFESNQSHTCLSYLLLINRSSS